jgi:hypothetical protein
MPQHAINEIHGAWFDPTNPGMLVFLCGVGNSNG